MTEAMVEIGDDGWILDAKDGTTKSLGLDRIVAYGTEAKIRVVAVKGAAGDWAAYVGLADRHDEWIATRGAKLFADEAAALFPILNPTRYRA